MKTLEIFAQQNNLKVIPITYKFQGFRVKRKGFDLCKPDGFILVSFEPENFNYSPFKWLLRHKHDDFKTNTLYLTRITAKWLKDNIDINANCSFRNSQV